MVKAALPLTLFVLAAPAGAQLLPGDVFREYQWRPTTRWQRCTGPDATDPGAKQFLPNPVNTVTLADLQGATRLVVMIEKLASHSGTAGPRIRMNKNAWLTIPDPDPRLIPGNRGQGLPVEEYLTMRYPTVEVPLQHIRQGSNTFEFTCRRGTALGRVWPQFLIYGVTFRVYYGSSKPRPTGEIVSPISGSELGANPTFEVKASSPAGIRQVDLIGNYDDFDWRGDGVGGQWQYHYHYGAIRKHIGTATAAPYRVQWDTTWIPTQPSAFSVIARIADKQGMVYITPAATGLTLRRSKTVFRYRSHNIPKSWQTRQHAPMHSCENSVAHDVRRASAARLFLATWNGYEAQEIGMNNTRVWGSIGKNHDLDYNTIDVKTSLLRQGRNTFYTRSTTSHHGIEVQWPGIELFVRYDIPESWAHYVTFAAGCRGRAGTPILSAAGKPNPTTTIAMAVRNSPAAAPVLHATGFSNRAWGPFRLPYDMRGAGAPGCVLRASPEFLHPTLTDAAGVAVVRWTVPNLKEVLGVTFFNQYLVPDPTANQLGLVVSNAGRATIGAW